MKENSNSIEAEKQATLNGIWGGQGISMEVSGPNATLTFDCAHGRITETIGPDSAGKFQVKGYFARERPGPTREDENNETAATFSGAVSGDTLTLTISLNQTREQVGTFTLTKGKQGRIRRCM